MKTILFTNILFLFFALNVNAQNQKVKVKKDVVSVNESPVFILVSTNYPDAYTLYSLSNEKLAVFSAQFYTDSKQVTPGNPNGRIGYFDITFFNDSMDKCEIRIVGMKRTLAELIVSEGLVKDGKLDAIAVEQFCRINGMKFTEDRKHAGTTIIINN